MTTQTDDAHAPRTERESGIWDLVSVADYRLPQTPATRAARARWVSLKRLFGGRLQDDEAPARAEADLRRLPERQLDAVAAAVNWTAAAAVLQHRLETGNGGDAVRFVIGPPHSGHVELLRRWGTEQGARWIEPPAYQDILEMGPAWLAGWPSEVDRWVMPRLEHCWLRHAAGLALVRKLLDRALSGRLGRGVIGCDSWAWAYFRYLAPLPTRSVLTLQAFDGDRLATLFRALVAPDGPGRVRFCNARTGKLILAVDRKDGDGDGNGDQDDDGNGGTELQSLAARSRGNAGLARDLWRARLSTAPDSEPDAAGGATDRDAVPPADGDDDGTTVWVAEPTEEPALAADRDEELALVLHALLLHNGLPGLLLAELLPLPPFRVQAILHRLAGAGVAAAGQGGHWHITAAGYPPVRHLLQAQGLLLDEF